MHADQNQPQTTLSDMTIAISGVDLADGVSFAIHADAMNAPIAVDGEPVAAAAISPRAGALDVTGKLVDLVTSESTFNRDHFKVQMTAKVQDMPSAIADALADMQGLLINRFASRCRWR
jgi:hypothetical protein